MSTDLKKFETGTKTTIHTPTSLCVECGEVTCLDKVRLTASSQRASEEIGEVNEILLRGHCNKCK